MPQVRSGSRGRPEAGDADGAERNKIALVLSGGGIPGWMYEIGALTALDEFFLDGFSTARFDIYVGTSAGASVAALLASGIRPRAVYDAIMQEAPSTFNFARRDVYGFGTRETWPMLKKTASVLWRLTRETAGRVLRRDGTGFSLLDLVFSVQESLPSGLFTLAPLEAHLHHVLTTVGRGDDFRGLGAELYIPAVDLDRGRYRVFGTPGFDHVPISRAVTASCAIPVLFQPVRIEGQDYIDGGTGRVANMDVAVDHGAGLLLVVNPVVHLDNDPSRTCLPTCYGFCKGLKEKGMSFVADQAMRINTGMRLRIAKAQQEHLFPGLEIAIIEPSPGDTVLFAQNVMGHESRKEALRYGYRSTAQYLIEHFDHLAELFARRGVAVGLSAFRGRPGTGGFRVLGPNERRRVPGAAPVSPAG
jgi:predicted acylesterase/phospholipase RssA